VTASHAQAASWIHLQTMLYPTLAVG